MYYKGKNLQKWRFLIFNFLKKFKTQPILYMMNELPKDRPGSVTDWYKSSQVIYTAYMPMTDFIKVNYGYSDIYGTNKSSSVIVDELKNYNIWAILIVAARLAVIFSNREYKTNAEQMKLLRSFFTESTLEKIYKILEYRRSNDLDDGWLFFNEPPLISLVSLALNNCDEEKGSDMASEDDLEKFGNWLLILAEEWTRSMQAPRGLRREKVNGKWRMSRYAVEGVRRGFAEQNFLNNTPHILHQFARISIIKRLTKDNPYGVDIESLFIEATGVTIDEYISFGFILLVNWSPDMGNEDLDKAVIKDMGYFSNIEIDTNKINLLLSLYSSTPKMYRQESDDIKSTILKGKKYTNNFMIFMRKPIVISDMSKFMCISQRYLIFRATNGVYWQMNEYLNRKADKKRLDRLPQAWGYGFELYVNERLQSAFGKKKYIANYKNTNGDELADGLVLGDKALFIIEIKSLHVPYQAQLKASRDNLKSTLKQLFGTRKTNNTKVKHKRKGLQQIYYLSDLIINGSEIISGYTNPGKIIPVIITQDDLPVDPLNRRYYNGYSSSVNGSHNSMIEPFIILNVEEVEYLEAIAIKNSTRAESLLIEYSQTQKLKNNMDMPTEVGGFKKFLDDNKIDLKNTKSLGEEFNRMAEEIRKLFFPKK